MAPVYRFSDVLNIAKPISVYRMVWAMATEFGKRILAALEHAGLTQMKLQARTGISQSTLSTAINKGNGSPRTASIAKCCGVDAYWLETGEGQMISGVTDVPAKWAVEKAEDDLPKTLQALATYLQQLDDTGKDQAAAILANLAKKPETHARVADVMQAILASSKQLAA